MSELPAAELPREGEPDPNEKAKRKQTLIWSGALALVGIPALFYAYSALVGSPATQGNKAEVARHTSATVDTAQGPLTDTPAEQLAGQLRDAKTTAQTAQEQNLALQAKVAELSNQLQTDRADATHTISALSNQIGTGSSGAAPGSGSFPRAGAALSAGMGGPSAGGAGAAPFPAPSPSLRASRGRNPFAPVGALAQAATGGAFPSASGVAGAAGDDDAPGSGGGADAAPHRTMSLIKASLPVAQGGGPGIGAGPATDGAPRSNSFGGAPAGPGLSGGLNGGGGPGGHGYFTSALETYSSDKYVPPNAYAEAKVLVGVDAATGTTYSADPKPVLFRLIGPAVHVGADGKYQKTDLTGCMVNGAAFGELPSEKVYIKLQKITCPAGAHHFSVATVEGYVSAHGKAGVRGQVISREGQFTGRALIAGALNGLGQGLSTNVQRSQSGLNTDPTGASGLLAARELSPAQIASGSIGAGISNASTMLADYYIKRAEQYQPVIEMPTGIQVEVVFLSGFQVK